MELDGILHFWSETGTEGGHWALQDINFIQKVIPKWGLFPKQQVFDLRNPQRQGLVVKSWKRNKWWKVWKLYLPIPDPKLSYGLKSGEITLNLICWDDGGLEKRGSNQVLVINWSYDGLHVLKNGDVLTIFSKETPTEIVWTGTIKLKNHRLFTEHAGGLWIHADQDGIDRETWAQWFFKEHPAKLIKTS